ncbi:LacI family DNA-binding transcriptional regulator [Burkholderia sp. MR1-5-21]
MAKAKSTIEDATGLKKPRSASVTLRDVAKFAGVSSATVSRMINRPEAVSDELRARITAAISHLGWVPHAAARALATQRTGTIGAVFPTVSNEHFATAIQELQEALESAGYTLLLGCSQYDVNREYNQVRNMLERGVDAVVLVGESHHPDLYPLLDQRDVPFVNTFTYRKGSEHLCVGVDNHKAFFDFTTYLLDLGHRRFAMLSQTVDSNDRAWARREGVRDALAERGLGISAAHMVEGFWGVGVGRQLFSQVMNTPQPPTVIICGNGSFAIGAMLEAIRSGYDIPRELSLVGFDDFELMSELPIPITTVRVPSAEIGRTAASMILTELSGERRPTSVECDAEIVIRASSAPPLIENDR